MDINSETLIGNQFMENKRKQKRMHTIRTLMENNRTLMKGKRTLVELRRGKVLSFRMVASRKAGKWLWQHG